MAHLHCGVSYVLGGHNFAGATRGGRHLCGFDITDEPTEGTFSLLFPMDSDEEWSKILVTHSIRQFRLKPLPYDANINTQLHSDPSIEFHQPILPYLLHDLPLQTPGSDLLPGRESR